MSLSRVFSISGRNSVFLLSGVVAVTGFAAFAFVQAADPPTIVSAAVADAANTSIRVEFSEPMFTDYDDTTAVASGDLVAADFSLNGGAGGAGITSVAKATAPEPIDGSVWIVTPTSVVAAGDSIGAVADTVFNAAGDSADPTQAPVDSLTPARLATIVNGLQELAQVDLFADGSYASPVGQPLNGETLDDLFAAGFAGLPSDPANEAELITSLAALSTPISSVTIVSGVVTLPMATTASVEVPVTFGLDDIGLSVAAPSVTVTRAVTGTIEVQLDNNDDFGVTTSAANELTVALTGNIDFDASGRLGFAEVTATAVSPTVSATFAVDLVDPTGPTPPSLVAVNVAVAGSADLDLDQFTVGGLQNPISAPTTITWDLATPEAPPTVDLSTLVSSGLANFANVDAQDVLNGLSFIATWLTEVETYGAMGAELPIVGDAAGDLADVAAQVNEAVEFLSEGVEAFSAGDEDPSVADVAELLCGAQLFGENTDCETIQAVLAPLTISTTEITYDLTLTKTVDPFDDGLPDSYELEPNDVCTAIAAAVTTDPITSARFRVYNPSILTRAACDQLAVGTTVNTALLDPGTTTPTATVTAAVICRGVAGLFDVAVVDFRFRNHFADDAACAAEIADGVGDPGAHPLVFDDMPDDGPSLDFAVGDQLDGLDVGVDGSVDWDTRNATIEFNFTLGLKIAPTATIDAELGLDPDDWDGDGNPNATDDDDDGDGKNDATADDDDDADGLPEDYVLMPNDVCRAIAGGVAGRSSTDFIAANASIANQAACDQLVAGSTINTAAPAATAVNHVLTTTDMCRSVAKLFQIGLADFKSYNSFVDDAGCAAELAAAASDPAAHPLSFDAELRFSLVTTGHRIFIGADPNTPLFTASLNLGGTGAASAHLGFLDVDIDGSLSLAPTFAVDLIDPMSSADDSKIDLVELRETLTGDASAAAKLDALVDLSAGGVIDGHFLVGSTGLGIEGTDRLRFDVVGNLSALDNGFGANPTPILETLAKAIDTSGTTDLTGPIATVDPSTVDTIYVGTNLDDLLNLESLTPAQIIDMMIALAERIDEMAGTDVLSQRLPLVDVTVSELVEFVQTFATLAEQVQSRNPEDLASLNEVISEILADLGVPDSVSVTVSADDIRFTFALDETVSASYPLNFELDGISLAPTDGGASVDVTAGVTWEPTIGLRFASGLDPLDRVFLTPAGPSFTASLNAQLEGGVVLGPFEASIAGDAMMNATVDTGLTDPTPGDDMVTFAELKDALTSTNPGDVLDVTFDGPLTADLDATLATPVGELSGAIKVRGNLTAFGAQNPFSFVALADLPTADPSTLDKVYVAHGIDVTQFKLDLRTIVNGSIETARFVGRTLEDAEGLNLDTPVIGDVLTTISPLGDDITAIANEIDRVWRADPTVFTSAIEAPLETLVFDAGICPSQDCVTVALLDAAGDPVTELNLASQFTLDLALEGEFTESTMLNAGLDLAPVFELDFELEPSVTFGYSFDVGFGVSLDEGFFVKGGEVIELYARATASNIVASATLLEIGNVDITDGAIVIGGTGGPDDDAASFAVCLLACDGSENLTMSALSNRSRSVDSLVTINPSIDLNVDLDVETSIALLPTIKFPLHFDIGYAGAGVTGPNLTLGTATDPVTLDAEEFVSGVILPGLTTLDQYNPLSDPNIQKVLNNEIPILETNLRTLAGEFATAPGVPPAVAQAWSVFEFLVDLKCTIADLDPTFPRPATCPTDGLTLDPGQIPLGHVTVLPSFSATPAGSTTSNVTAPAAGPAAAAAGCPTGTSPLDRLRALICSINGRATTDPPMFRSDLLDNPIDAVKLLLGGELASDTVFVEFNAPPIRVGPSIKFEQELFSLETGFLDGALTVGFDGFLGLDIKVGFGYDSSGLGPGKNFINGFYLVDYGADDTEDFEVQVGGSVDAFVDGKLSVLGGLADVRFRGSGGVKLVGGIDLNDESIAVPAAGRGDGKFHLDEMLAVIDAHDLGVLCLFNVGIDFDGYLSFAGKAKVLGVTVFNDSFSTSFTILNERLSCTPKFRVAQLVGGELILNGGPVYGADRFDGLGDIAEQFTLTRNGNNVDVSFASPNSGTRSYATLSFPVSGITKIIGDLGASVDSVTVVGDIPIPMMLSGGAAGDTLNGGSGPDQIVGGPGGDTINGNSGADTLDGGTGSDSLNGGPGADIVNGGAGNDELVGGANNDVLGGGADNDTYRLAGTFGQDSVVDANGTETLDLSGATGPLTGTSSFGEGLIRDPAGNSVAYATNSIDIVLGSDVGDSFDLKAGAPQGFRIDGRGGGDTYNAFLAGAQRTIIIDDSAGATDTVNINGTVGANRFLLRKADNGSAFVALLSASRADRVNYNSAIEQLNVYGLAGGDNFTVDDNAATTHIVGGEGSDTVQVGQIYGLAACEPNDAGTATCPGDIGSTRDGSVGVDPADTFSTTVITRGHLSNGVTQPLTIDGDAGEDTITIFSNRAPVTANGGADNDRFVARAFIITDTVQLNGDGDIDDFDYVLNEKLSVDGGEGVDTFTIVGTEANDGFVVDRDVNGAPTITLCKIDPVTGLPDLNQPCAINAQTDNVEVFELLGIEGDDVFWIRSTDAATLVQMAGGEHSDRFVIGDGTVAEIDGPVTIAGDDSGTVPGIPDPVVLPAENTDPAFAPAVTGGTDRGDTLEIDASTDTADLTGEVTDTAVRGLGMASGPFTVGSGTDIQIVAEVLAYDDLEFVDITLGSGNDDVTITSTHVGNAVCDPDGCPLALLTAAGTDDVDVQSVAGETVVDLGADDDIITVGAPTTGGDELEQVDAKLTVLGGSGADTADLDDTADSTVPTFVDIDPGVITKAGLASGGVVHSEIETVHVRLGDLDDTVNVRGTAADALTATHVHGNGGDDRFLVSSAATLITSDSIDHLGGDVDDVAGPLFIHGDGGAFNQLLVSDRDAAAGNPSVAYDGQTLNGLSPAPIHHDVTGAFGGGITIWSSELADELAVTGSDLSTVSGTRTLTTLNSGDGVDVVTVDLAGGVDGPFVVNAEEGADTVNAGGSSLDLLVFGGLGADDITTGSGDDIVLGDLGTIATADGGTVTGGGGPGDMTDGGTQPIDQITSDPSGGDNDVIGSGAGDDLVFGGTGGDDIHGGPDQDVLIGGHSIAGAPDAGDTIDGDAGDDVIAGDNARLDNGGSTDVLVLLDVETTASPAAAGSGAGDIIRGGADDDAIYGQQGGDDLSGDAGDDAIEGNAGADTISGGDDQDDLIGGGSALDGVLDDDRAWTVAGVGLADTNDTVDGGGDADVILGDNGQIQRSIEGDGTHTTLADLFGAQNPVYDTVVNRTVQMTNGIDPDGSFGSDHLLGGDGHDEIYGQLDTMRTTVGGNVIEGDELSGGADDDVLVGDLGVVTTVLEDGSRQAAIAANGPFLAAEIHTAGTLTREVTLYIQHDGDHVDEGDGSDATQFGAEGDDLLNGDAGDDVVHGGPGADIANGGDGIDVVFGGDGQDALWGGPDADELFGGHDEDAIDVMPRDFTTTTRGRNRVVLGPDPDIWFEAAPSFSALGGQDFGYGGWNADELQADEQVNGPQPGDRLLDWHGSYNTYLGCSNGAGAGSFLRSGSPSNRAFVAELAAGRGAVDALIVGASGYRELGLVQQADGSSNTGSGPGDTRHVACP